MIISLSFFCYNVVVIIAVIVNISLLFLKRSLSPTFGPCLLMMNGSPRASIQA